MLGNADSRQEIQGGLTLDAIQSIASAVQRDGISDVVTGFGVLNEPFQDCDMTVVRDYNDKALSLIRSTLGNEMSIYIGDLFNSTLWQDDWWDDVPNTYLDSHYYHVFAEKPRALSPRQHIAYVCRKNARDTDALQTTT